MSTLEPPRQQVGADWNYPGSYFHPLKGDRAGRYDGAAGRSAAHRCHASLYARQGCLGARVAQRVVTVPACARCSRPGGSFCRPALSREMSNPCSGDVVDRRQMLNVGVAGSRVRRIV